MLITVNGPSGVATTTVWCMRAVPMGKSGQL